ncbi:MAG: response regulator [Saprospiraceae bacterium]|nr:response regulator [Saprospiraceae bacterium]
MQSDISEAQRIIIVDDDDIFSEDLKNKLNVNGYSNVVIKPNFIEFINDLENLDDTDIIILDIIFGVENILNLPNNIKEQLKKLNIIFITSSEDSNIYEKIQDFEDSFFIIKPFHFYTIDRLIQSLIKNQTKILIKDGRKKYYIDKIEIICFEVNGNYSVLKTRSKQYVYKKSLKQIFIMFHNLDLVQVHRNFAVPKSKIQLINFREKYLIIDGINIPLSYKYKEYLTDIN